MLFYIIVNRRVQKYNYITGHDHTAQPHDQQRMNIVALHHQMPRNLIIQHVNSRLFSRTINIHLQTHNLSTIILSYRLDTFR
jgi:hypothetical protein